MSDSRRARTIRRLRWRPDRSGHRSGHRAGGRQQQGRLGANVNVISGTVPTATGRLQRQNEPTMACSSRNPQNCLAGANDYRTVDIPFPASEKRSRATPGSVGTPRRTAA